MLRKAASLRKPAYAALGVGRIPLVAASAAALILLCFAFTLPKLTADPFLLSFVPTAIVALLGTLHVWLLLRVSLLSFASPAFMAIGGYTAALLATKVTANAVVLVIASLFVPAIFALFLGILVLRLRGTYFALVTFVLAQIIVLFILINPRTLGGNSGISGVPPARLGSMEFAAEGDLVRFSVAVGIAGTLLASALAIGLRRHFAGINENERLSASLGLRPWAYKTVNFVVASGIAGLAGLVLVNQTGNAHPDSFDPFLAVNYVAAAVVGGAGSILGVFAGALAISWLAHIFASQAEYAQMLLGIALIVVVLYARDGVTGLAVAGARSLGLRPQPARTGKRSVRRGPPASPTATVRAHDSATTQARQAEPARSRKDSAGEGSTSTGTVLEVVEVSKSFGGVSAVDGVGFRLEAGEIIGVIGPNGAGKTTLINMLAGELAPSSGVIRIRGSSTSGSPSYRVARFGVARSYQQTSVFSSATVEENLARARTFSPRWMEAETLDRLLRQTGLADRRNDVAGDLPYGLQKVLGLVIALATEPRVLLLDEPAAGLEISERKRVDDVVHHAVSRGCSVVLVEHDMDVIRRICERVLVMDAGKPLADGPASVVLSDPKVIAAYLGDTDEETEWSAASGEAAAEPAARSGGSG